MPPEACSAWIRRVRTTGSLLSRRTVLAVFPGSYAIITELAVASDGHKVEVRVGNLENHSTR